MSLSIPTTRAPSFPNRLTVSDPINPADPVTIIVRMYGERMKKLQALCEFLSIQKFPSANQSVFVRRKQSRASCGRHTTGSFSLKEVFRTIGMEVRRQNSEIS